MDNRSRISGIRPARWRREGPFAFFGRVVEEIVRAPSPMAARLDELVCFFGFVAALARAFGNGWEKGRSGG